MASIESMCFHQDRYFQQKYVFSNNCLILNQRSEIALQNRKDIRQIISFYKTTFFPPHLGILIFITPNSHQQLMLADFIFNSFPFLPNGTKVNMFCSFQHSNCPGQIDKTFQRRGVGNQIYFCIFLQHLDQLNSFFLVGVKNKFQVPLKTLS